MLALWPIDILREPADLLERSAELLDLWAARTQVTIEPVFVLGGTQRDFEFEATTDSLNKRALKALNATVEQYASHHAELERSLTRATVLLDPGNRISTAVNTLEEHAMRRNADFIALPTHGRKGVARLVLGSFAETLLLRSQVPTVTLGPRLSKIRPLRRILHATDFGSGSEQHFRSIIGFAKGHGSKVWLYHSVPNLVEPIFQSGAYLFSGAWIPARNYFHEESQNRFRRGHAWARWARNQGVDCEFVLDETPGVIREHLLQFIDDHQVGLLSIASRTGPVSATLLGSIARQLVREASCPVWITHARR